MPVKLPQTGVKPLDRYTEAVMDGSIPVCKWVKLAVERHYKDLARQDDPDFPYKFEPAAVHHFVDFFADHLQHFDGIHAGNPIEFEDWQYFVWGSPFGWIKKERINGMPIRRFKEIIVIIPKKQGKSIVIAGMMIYMFDYDGWHGAQVYALAKNRSHAEKLGYRDAETMVEESEGLMKRFRVNHGAAHRGIYCDDMNSFIQPLTSKPESTDGLKVHMAANDEIKDWTDLEIYEIMKDGTAANPNAVIANITTAGSDRSSLGFEREKYLKDLLEGIKTNEQVFGVIYTIDEEDRAAFNEGLAAKDPWAKVEPIIKKANPNYGVSVGEDYYKSRINEAKDDERKKNQFLTKHLNVWINAMDHYFNITSWTNHCQAAGLISEEKLAGRPCYLFLDLASKKDICAMYALFPYGKTQDGKKRYATLGHNFLPEAVVSENLVGRRGEYNSWAEQGHFTLTPGNTTDFATIKEKIYEFGRKFNVLKVGFDPREAAYLSQEVQKMRMKVITIDQRVKYLSEPMKVLRSWITYRRPGDEGKGIVDPRIMHNGDPVLTWTLSNVVAKEDANENVFPRKEHKDSKIDGAVALINLIALEMEQPLPKMGGGRRVPKVWSV